MSLAMKTRYALKSSQALIRIFLKLSCYWIMSGFLYYVLDLDVLTLNFTCELQDEQPWIHLSITITSSQPNSQPQNHHSNNSTQTRSNLLPSPSCTSLIIIARSINLQAQCSRNLSRAIYSSRDHTSSSRLRCAARPCSPRSIR